MVSFLLLALYKRILLEVSYGEGRQYNLLAVDYSKTVINKCNKLTNNEYINNFRQSDIIKDKLNNKYK